MKHFRMLVAVVTMAVCAGCSDDATITNDAGTDSATTTPKAGEVVVTVRYAGAKKGTALSVALFSDFPPKGPPAGVAAVKAPLSFPSTLRVPNVASGTYVAVARLTAEGNDPQAQTAQPGDLQVASSPLTLSADKGVETSVELTER